MSSADKSGTPEKSSPIKDAVKLYGKTVVVVYVTVGLVNLSICYLAVAKWVFLHERAILGNGIYFISFC